MKKEQVFKFKFDKYDKDACRLMREFFGENDFNSLLTDGENEYLLEVQLRRFKD